MMGGAANWLKNRMCSGNNGIVVIAASHRITSQLYHDKEFVWSSKGDAGSLGVDGFYEGFPVVWSSDEEEQAGNPHERPAPKRERVIAIDLSEWRGIAVRHAVITERKPGHLTIRAKTDDEIEKEKASGRLKEGDEDKARCICPVEICLHWRLNHDKPPHTKAFEVN
jgi:hypothetical protein